jgi:amino acid adenylation domain-containing protein
MDCPDSSSNSRAAAAAQSLLRHSAPFRPLVSSILQALRARPEACAIRFCNASISNAALLDKVLRMAAQLPACGIERGTRVGCCFERGPDTLVALLALWLNGAVYVPLDGTLPRERLFAMSSIAALDVLLAQPALRDLTDSLPCSVITVEPMRFNVTADRQASPAGSDACDDNDVGIDVEPDDLAYILFTSGSSGTPKGVMISQGNIAALFAAVMPLLGLPSGCRILACANFSFDISLFELLAPLLCGGTLVLAGKSACANAAQLAALIEREQVTVVQATPSHWQLLNALPWTAPLTLAIATGEALPRTLAAAILQRTPLLWNLYGPTECTVWASAHRVRDIDLGETVPATISIGSALPGYDLQLQEIAETAEEQPAAGELVIGGCGVGPGYCGAAGGNAGFNTPDAARTYRSGDLCRLDADGLLHYLGRRDNQVKHNGYRIELDEIALLLQQHMSVASAVCLLQPAGADTDSLLFACAVFKPGMPNRNKAQLNEYLATHLPAWMLPQRYFFLDELPLTANGKLDRAALLQLTRASTRPALDGSLESRVAQVFCDILDLDNIGPCDSFLDAGGSSMLAATLVLTLNERLGSSLTLRQALVTPPTVRSVVQLLSGNNALSTQGLHAFQATHLLQAADSSSRSQPGNTSTAG